MGVGVRAEGLLVRTPSERLFRDQEGHAHTLLFTARRDLQGAALVGLMAGLHRLMVTVVAVPGAGWLAA